MHVGHYRTSSHCQVRMTDYIQSNNKGFGYGPTVCQDNLGKSRTTQLPRNFQSEAHP